jgi:hypothetical protein
MKTLLLTGHTYGLGKYLYDNLSDNYHIIGISRSTGYDLTNHKTVMEVVEKSLDVDHVLNVCKIAPAQADLLLEIHRLWDSNKKYGKIISIGGLTETFSWNMIRQAQIHQTDYIAAKHNLAKAHFDLASIHPYRAQPQSVLIRPLNIGTKSDEEGREKEPFVTEKEIYELVKLCLEKEYYLSTIDLRGIESC